MIHPHVFQKWNAGTQMMDRFADLVLKASRAMESSAKEMLALKIHASQESIAMTPILHLSSGVDHVLRDTEEMESLAFHLHVNKGLRHAFK